MCVLGCKRIPCDSDLSSLCASIWGIAFLSLLHDVGAALSLVFYFELAAVFRFEFFFLLG